MKPLYILGFALASLTGFGADKPPYDLPVGDETYLTTLGSYATALLKPEFSPQKTADGLLAEKFLTDWHLSEEEAKRAVTSLTDAKYSIQYPAGKDCNPYTEAILKTDIKYRERLLSQIDEVATFLSDYHFRMFGRNESLFKVRRVNICTIPVLHINPTITYDRLKAELTLWVGPKHAPFIPPIPARRNNLHPWTAKEIKDGWDDGDHWKTDISLREIVDSKKNPIRGYWNFINPIGKTRVLLREFIKKSAILGHRSLVELLNARDVVALRKHIASTLGAPRKSVDEATDETIQNVFSQWAAKLISAESGEKMAAGALISCIKKRMVKQEKIGIKRTQIGFVNVENFHKIDVSLATGDVLDFSEEVVVPETLDIEVTQIGLVNVSTTDKVDVSVALAAMATPEIFQRASLKSVLKALKL